MIKRSCNKSTIDDKGSVLVMALLILVILTILGISASTTTEIEIQIAGNEKFHKIAFYNADSGIYSTPKLIRKSVEDGGWPATGFVPIPGSNFFREVMGYDVYDADKDVKYTLGGNTFQVDVERTEQKSLAGGGTEFGSGAEGAGVGSVGGVVIIYTMVSTGEGPSSSGSTIEGVYRLVPSVAGGM
jgi:hypothetical protein